MIFVTLTFFLATLIIGVAQTLQGEVLPGLSFMAAGLLAYWAGSSLKLAIFAPSSPPRRVGFALAALLTALALRRDVRHRRPFRCLRARHAGLRLGARRADRRHHGHEETPLHRGAAGSAAGLVRRHCEERSDAAIHLGGCHQKMDCRVAFGSSQ